MLRFLVPIALAVIVGGCAKPTSTETPSGSSFPEVEVIEAIPPDRIGDGSPTVFTHLKGLRKGSGAFWIGESQKKFETIEFEFNPDHSLSLKLGDGKAQKGTWARSEDGKFLTFQISVGSDWRKLGEGKVQFMDRANPYRFEYKGVDEAGKKVRFEFKAGE